MFSWIAENIGTIVVSALILAVISLIIFQWIKKKKKGKSILCNCASCDNCTSCSLCKSCTKKTIPGETTDQFHIGDKK